MSDTTESVRLRRLVEAVRAYLRACTGPCNAQALAIDELTTLVDAQERRIKRDTEKYEKLRLTYADWQKHAAVWQRHLKNVVYELMQKPSSTMRTRALANACNVLDNGPQADPYWDSDREDLVKNNA